MKETIKELKGIDTEFHCSLLLYDGKDGNGLFDEYLPL